MFCPKCGTTISEESTVCPKCGFDTTTADGEAVESAPIAEKATTNATTSQVKNNPTNSCKSGAIASFVFSALFFLVGLYKMFVYNNGDDYPYKPANVYVGGDAYNLIINGTYAAAFFVLAAGLLTFGVGLLIYGELKLQREENSKIELNSVDK